MKKDQTLQDSKPSFLKKGLVFLPNSGSHTSNQTPQNEVFKQFAGQDDKGGFHGHGGQAGKALAATQDQQDRITKLMKRGGHQRNLTMQEQYDKKNSGGASKQRNQPFNFNQFNQAYKKGASQKRSLSNDRNANSIQNINLNQYQTMDAKPAGLEQFQNMSSGQMFGLRGAQADLAFKKSRKTVSQNKKDRHKRFLSYNEKSLNEISHEKMSNFENRQSRQLKRRNLFNEILLPAKQISARANEIITGERESPEKNQNEKNAQLIPKFSMDKKERDLDEIRQMSQRKASGSFKTLEPPKLFKQLPIHKDNQLQTLMAQNIEKSGRVFNKHYQNYNNFERTDQYHTQPKAISTFPSRNQAIRKIEHSFAASAIQSNSKSDIKSNMLQDDSLIKDLDGGPTLGTQRTNMIADITAPQSKQDHDVSQTLTSALPGDQQTQFKSIIPADSPSVGMTTRRESPFIDLADNLANKLKGFGQDQSAQPIAIEENTEQRKREEGQFQLKLKSNLQPYRELETLHPYDSLLLDKSFQKKQLIEKIEKRRLQFQYSSFSLTGPTNLKFKGQNDRTNSEMDSSEHSNVAKVKLGNRNIETLVGTKLSMMSPITRRLNTQAANTITHLEQYEKQQDIKKQIQERILMNLLMQVDTPGVTLDDIEDPKAQLEENANKLKILKNNLKSLVTTEQEKYVEITPNDKGFKKIETLPDMLPTYCRVQCGGKRSPSSIELIMDDVDAVHIMISTIHPFPGKQNPGSLKDSANEKEKLYIKDPRISQKLKEEVEAEIAEIVQSSGVDPATAKKQLAEKDKGQQNRIALVQINSIAQMRCNQVEKEKKKIFQQKTSIESMLRQQFELDKKENDWKQPKKSFKFAKAEFKECFDADDYIYFAIISNRSGHVQIRTQFLDEKGFYPGQEQNEQAAAAAQEPEINPEKIIEELKNWFHDNRHKLSEFKFTLNGGFHTDLVKSHVINVAHVAKPENQAAQLQIKSVKNAEKRSTAFSKKEELMIQKYKYNQSYLNKWEDYRENKIEMTAIFIKVLKRKNFTRRWLKIHKYGQIYAKVVENLRIRRHLNHRFFNQLHTAIRWKIAYKYKYKRQFGGDFDHRIKNQIRRAFTFGACAYISSQEGAEGYLSNMIVGFLRNYFLKYDFCCALKNFYDKSVHIQKTRKHLNLWREARFGSIVYKRLLMIKDYLLEHYKSKEGKKSKNATKISKALKKIFNPAREEDYAQIKDTVQEKLGRKYILESKQYVDSVNVRSYMLVANILASGKAKDSEGVKIHKEEIDKLKKKCSTILYKFKKRKEEIVKAHQDTFSITAKDKTELETKAKYKTAEGKAATELLSQFKACCAEEIIKKDKLKVTGKFIKKYYENKAQELKKQGQGADEKEVEGEEQKEKEGEEDKDQEQADGESPEKEGDNAEGEEKDEEAKEEGDEEQKENDGEGEADGEAQDGEQAEDGGEEAKDDGEDDEAGGDGAEKKTKKKKGKKPEKKKKYVDPDQTDFATIKEDPKGKFKFQLDEKIDIPEDIAEYIQENFPEKDVTIPPPEDQPDEEEKVQKRKGVDLMTMEEVKELVWNSYKIQEHKKMLRYFGSYKMRYPINDLLKMVLHIALNMGPKGKANEDIEDALKDSPSKKKLEDQADQTKQEDNKTDEKKEEEKPEEEKEKPAELEKKSSQGLDKDVDAKVDTNLPKPPSSQLVNEVEGEPVLQPKLDKEQEGTEQMFVTEMEQLQDDVQTEKNDD